LPEFDIDFGEYEGNEGIRTEILHEEVLYKD